MSSGFWQIPTLTLENLLGFLWDAAKAAVPAAVAWVAYKVSIEAKEATQAQRDIAANQYKISLYDVRKRALLSLDEWLSENTTYNSNTLSNLQYIENIICDIENVFDLDKIVDLDVNIEIMRINIEEIESLDVSYRFSCKEINDLHRKGALATQQQEDDVFRNSINRSSAYGEFYNYLKRISDECRSLLQVPTAPY